jgi:cytochrome P450
MADQASLTTSKRLVPPAPEPAPDTMGPLELARRMRTNGITPYTRRAYEEEVTQRRYFGRTMHVLNAPDAIRRVLVDNHECYGRTRASLRILRPLVGAGLLVSEGADWRHQRRTLAPAFTPKAVGLLAPHMLGPTEEAMADLRAARGGPVNLFAAVQRLALEIAGRTMFSLEMREHSGVLRDMVGRYNVRLARLHLLDIVLPVSIPSPHDIARRFFARGWMVFFEDLIARRRQAGTGATQPRDLFDLLLAARDPETGQAFSSEQLRDQAATMIMAGHETTAVALSWALYLLALAPDIQDRAAAEAMEAEDGADGAPALGRLVYTRAIIDETMRLYPPAFVIPRAARERDEVVGVQIQPGDIIVVSPWVLHRHRRRWTDPDAFDPERFLPSAPPVDRYTYLPFGLGPRVCIGAHFALAEATLVLSRLLKNFRIELVSSKPVMPIGVVTTQPDHQPPFKLHAREG